MKQVLKLIDDLIYGTRNDHMRLASKILIGVFIILWILVGALQKNNAVSAETLQQDDKCYLQLQASNYCQSCHSAGDDRLVDATAWSGGIDRASVSPCPAVKTIHEELYYTERLLLAIDRGMAELPASTDTSSINARLSSATQTYSRLLDSPVTSLDAFVSEAQVLRFRLGKIYTQINQIIENQKQFRIMVFAGLITLLLFFSLLWGWINARRASLSAGVSGKLLRLRPNFWIFVFLVFILFSLPIFRGASQEITETSLEQQEQQAVLDSALRSADTSDRELSRSWMLAQVAAVQNEFDAELANQTLDQALLAAEEAKRNSYVVWGEAKAAQEAAIGEWAAEEKALFITSQLDAMRSRAWGLQKIAEQWVSIDPQKSGEILEKALVVAQDTVGDYYDLDARSIAVTYAQFDVNRSLEIIDTIDSLFIRTWGLREIAVLTGDPTILDQAAKTAQQIVDPIFRAFAFREIGVATGQVKYFDVAKESLLGVDNQDIVLAYSWADLIASSGDSSLLDQIDKSFPAARVVALLGTEQFEAAWSEAQRIQDPFERAKAQTAVVSQWGKTEQAQTIEIPVFRDQAKRNVSVKLRDVSLAKKIENVYYRSQALTLLEEFDSAIELAPELNDRYPLIQLVENLPKQNNEAALSLIDLMDREADKAKALKALAVSSGDSQIFERALSMALAARVRGDNLAPSLASLKLGMEIFDNNPELAKDAFTQAFDIAWRMLIKYE